MALCKTYNSNQVILLVGNVPIDAGRDSGEFVNITFEADIYSDQVGADGEVARYGTNDDRATVTITLMQTSSGNDVLSTFAERDRQAKLAGTAGAKVTFSLRDLSGRTQFSANNCWIQKLPDSPLGSEIKTRAWTLRAADMKGFIGGNQELV